MNEQDPQIQRWISPKNKKVFQLETRVASN